MKPGIQTTEFYLTILGQVLSFLVVINIIPSNDVATLHETIVRMVVAATAVVTGAWQIVSYVKSRTELKK